MVHIYVYSYVNIHIYVYTDTTYVFISAIKDGYLRTYEMGIYEYMKWAYTANCISISNGPLTSSKYTTVLHYLITKVMRGYETLTREYFTDVKQLITSPLQWHHNECDSVSNHRRLHCLVNCWFRGRSKIIPKLRSTGLWEGNSPVTGEFHALKASNAGNVSISWRHHGVWFYLSIQHHRILAIWFAAPCSIHTCESGLILGLPSQWEMALLSNDVSHWLGANVESAL